MTAIIVSEFKLWNAKYRYQTLGPIIASVIFSACFGGLSPEICLSGLMASFIWLGVTLGDRTWSEVGIRRWSVTAGLNPLQIVSGKILATGSIFLFHYFILLPVIFLMTVLWGIEWWNIFGVSLLILVFTLLTAGFGLISRISESFSMFLTLALLLGWLLITWVIPQLWFINPFYQIGMLAAPGVIQRVCAGILANFALLTFICWLSTLLYMDLS